MSYLPVPGERIRDYEILGRIGAGGMGVVFNARDLKLDRIVALKFLSAKLTYTADEKRGLLQEARLISALDHPNICTIYAVEERTLEDSGNQIFIVMGYYDGGSLADHIGAGPMLLPDILDLLTGTASGLGAAHARRVVHRDIKPSNILLTRESLVKIVDFGLAKIVSSSSQTQSADNSGTLAYMAPEQISGEVVDQRADIWAVGVLAAEMLSGVHPFKRDNLAAAAFAICHDAPRVAEDAPLALQGIIYKCLSKDPALRYQSCEELLDDLRPLRMESAHLPSVQGVGTSGAKSGGPASGSHGSRSRSAGGTSAVGWLTERKVASTKRKALESSILAASGLRNQRRGWPWWWIPAAVAVLAVAVLLVPSLRERLAGVLLSPSEKHIAVLPFDNLDGNGDGKGNGNGAGDAVAGGLMDSMTGALSNLDSGGKGGDQKSLWVVPSSLVRTEHVADPSSALKKLGATLVVKGSIAHTGKSVTLVANLINTKTMAQIGAATAFNADGDLAAAQEQVVVQLGRMLSVSVGQAEGPHVASSAPAAYDLYLEALSYMQRFDKPGNLELALARLQTAIGEDPQFAIAYATQGEAYRLKYEADSDGKWLRLASANCEQAIKLNPSLPGAYVTLGDIHAVTGHAELAADEFQRALSLDSRNPAAISGLGWSYEHSGRMAEAEAEYKKALVLRPGDWYSNNRLALFYERQGRYNDAIAQVKQVIEMTPDNRNAYYDLGAFYLEAGDPANYKAAEDALKKSLAISPNYPAYGNLGLLYLEEKRYKEAAQMAEKALAINDQDLLPWSYSELAYRWLHDDKRADAALGRMQSMAEAQVKVNPQGAEAQSWLGLVFAKRGFKEKALPHMEAAIALAPTDQQVLVNAIEAYVIIGDDATALGLMQQAKQGGVALPDLKLEPRMQPLLLKIKV